MYDLAVRLVADDPARSEAIHLAAKPNQRIWL
jgi:hypothetical protein